MLFALERGGRQASKERQGTRTQERKATSKEKHCHVSSKRATLRAASQPFPNYKTTG